MIGRALSAGLEKRRTNRRPGMASWAFRLTFFTRIRYPGATKVFEISENKHLARISRPEFPCPPWIAKEKSAS